MSSEAQRLRRTAFQYPNLELWQFRSSILVLNLRGKSVNGRRGQWASCPAFSCSVSISRAAFSESWNHFGTGTEGVSSRLFLLQCIIWHGSHTTADRAYMNDVVFFQMESRQHVQGPEAISSSVYHIHAMVAPYQELAGHQHLIQCQISLFNCRDISDMAICFPGLSALSFPPTSILSEI
jgi:hypothetical protein